MIKVELNKRFKKEEMQFSFELKENRCVVFGPSGCGKTTLLRMLCGVCSPDSGHIEANGRVLYSSSQSLTIPIHKRNIGYIPQESALFPNMTIRKNILYGINVSGRVFDEARFSYLIHKLQIAAKLDEYPVSLSGGQKQRAALARTLMTKPDLLLMDEPFTALDAPIRNCLRDIVSDFSDEENIPLIFVSHSIEDCYAIGKEIVVMDAGKIVEYGCACDILEKPQFFRTAKLLDYRNLWEIERIGEKGLIFFGNGESLYSEKPDSMERKYICARPEKIRLLNDNTNLPSGLKNIFRGRIAENHGRGAYRNLLFISDSGCSFEIFVSEIYLKKSALSKGDRAIICLEEEALIFCR